MSPDGRVQAGLRDAHMQNIDNIQMPRKVHIQARFKCPDRNRYEHKSLINMHHGHGQRLRKFMKGQEELLRYSSWKDPGTQFETRKVNM